MIITDPPNGPVLFRWMASVVVCNTVGVWAGWPPSAWTVGALAAATAQRASTAMSC